MIEEARVSQGYVRKTAQEVARVRWLEAHGKELRTALWGTPQAEKKQLDHDDASPQQVGANGVHAQILPR